MLGFRRIELSDKTWVEPLLAKGNQRGSEYTFSNNFIYRKIYSVEIAQMDQYYIVFAGRNDENYTPSYLYPSGSGDIKPVIQALRQDAKRRGIAFRMHGITNENQALIETLFPDEFDFTPTRDSFDYIYKSESLITLSGKKLHSKRNFINRFKTVNEGNWSYEAITPENLDECWKMNVLWCEKYGCGEDPELMEEACAVRNCFNNFQALGLLGGLLRLDGKIVAFTMGRPLNSDTFIVHIEKAFSDVPGAYPMINQQFVTHNCADFEYVNREDDVGDEGLRKAKLSYKPAILLEKFALTEK